MLSFGKERLDEFKTMAAVYAQLHDSQLYVGDVELISRSGWLNDQCISFWEQHLKHAQPSSNRGSVFLEPCSAFMLQYIAAEDLLADTPDNQFRLLRTASLIFLPINDSSDAEAVGAGTHWSLLVVEVARLRCHYYDSCARSAPPTLRATVAKLSELLGLGRGEQLEVAAAECPRQTNGFDCGVHVLMLMTALAEQEAAAPAGGAAVDRALAAGKATAAAATGFRAQMLEVAEAAARGGAAE